MGLVTEVVPEGELMARVHALAALLLKNSPESMSAVKKMLSGFAKERLDRDLARAMRWNEKIRNSADFREGLQRLSGKARSGVAGPQARKLNEQCSGS